MGTNFQVYARHLPLTAGPILSIFFPFHDVLTYIRVYRTRVT